MARTAVGEVAPAVQTTDLETPTHVIPSFAVSIDAFINAAVAIHKAASAGPLMGISAG
jgi:hypothetical protein